MDAHDSKSTSAAVEASAPCRREALGHIQAAPHCSGSRTLVALSRRSLHTSIEMTRPREASGRGRGL